MGWLILHVIAIFCITLTLLLVALILFEPGLRYRIHPRKIPIDSPEFLRLLGAAVRCAGACLRSDRCV